MFLFFFLHVYNLSEMLSVGGLVFKVNFICSVVVFFSHIQNPYDQRGDWWSKMPHSCMIFNLLLYSFYPPHQDLFVDWWSGLVFQVTPSGIMYLLWCSFFSTFRIYVRYRCLGDCLVLEYPTFWYTFDSSIAMFFFPTFGIDAVNLEAGVSSCYLVWVIFFPPHLEFIQDAVDWWIY